MSEQAWLTLSVVGLVLGLLAFTQIAADVVLVGAVALLLLAGVLTPGMALAGMANEGMVTVGVLYVVVAGLEATAGTIWVGHKLLGRPQSVLGAQIKVMLPVMAVSAVLNNTPVVAMFMPAVKEWAAKHRISVSKLMIPLSYAAIFGGCCTLIGTSTNIVVNGLVLKQGLPSLGMWEISWVGVPCAVAGIVFIILLGNKLLPDRRPAISSSDDPREYTVEMLVEPGSALVGQTIEAAGLRQLPNMFLAEIERKGEIFPAVSPQETLQADDRLVFVGVVTAVVDLQRIRGLKPATNQVFKLDTPRSKRILIEAVVSNSCRLIGQTIRDGKFRTVYNAVVIAVARNGERINKKIGDIVLQPGDTLLVEALSSFVEQQQNSRDFFLVSQVENSNPPRHERAALAIGILVALIVVVSFEWMDMLKASMLAAGAMIITRCCTASVARRSVDWQVLIAIAASFGLGEALKVSGAAQFLANEVIKLGDGQPWLTLAVFYGVTLLLTELVTNNAAAVLMFPIGLATATGLNVDFKPFIIVIMMAASSGFATPLGYQTHMMVYGPGGYHFRDFLRIGIPLDLVIWAVTVIVVPLVWPLALNSAAPR